MKNKALRTWLPAALFCCFAATPLLAQAPWIHIEVDEADEDASHVKVNLPLSIVEIALEAAPEKILDEGRIHLHHVDEDIEVEDLRRMWRELRDAGDTEIVSVENEEESVSIRREGDEVRIEVQGRAEADEKVSVRVPVSVVDALFSGEGNELNVKDAVSELKGLRGDVVRVEDGATKVRIWIDERE